MGSAGRDVVSLEVESETSVIANEVLGELLSEAGWRHAHALRVPVKAPPHWEDVADRILRHAPAVLFVSHFLPDVAELQRILASRRFRGLVYYVYAASIPRFQKVAGRSAEGGIVWSSVTARYDDAMGERFQRQFMLRYGEAPAGRKRARPTTR